MASKLESKAFIVQEAQSGAVEISISELPFLVAYACIVLGQRIRCCHQIFPIAAPFSRINGFYVNSQEEKEKGK